MKRLDNAVFLVILWAMGKLYRRPKFRKWLELEDKKVKILKAIEEKKSEFPELLFSYLSIAFWFPKWLENKVSWEVPFYLFFKLSALNSPHKKIPLLESSSVKERKDTWDYEGRLWYLYSHLFSKTYGWTLEQIAQMDVDDALALIQELLTDEQLDKEFLWGMSDKSYIYNYETKTGKPNPLPRPYWMQEKVELPKLFQMPKGMLPAGVNYDDIPEQLRPKEKVEP